MLTFFIISVLILMAMSAFFSGSETAVLSANRARLYNLHMEGEREATEALGLLNNTQRLVAVVLVGNNIALVLTSLVSKELMRRIAPASWETTKFLSFNYVELAVLIGLTPVFLLLAEILPKQIFLAKADFLILRIQSALRFTSLILTPIVAAVNGITFLVLRPLGLGKRSPLQKLSREEMLEILRDVTPPPSEQTSFPREMIYNVLQLKTTLVREVMKPIVDVVAVRLEANNVDSVLALTRATGYSRYPVYRDRIVNLIGYVDVYKMLRESDRNKPLADFVEPATFIPEIAPVDTLLQTFLKKGSTVAIAIDEYGGCSGWISLEDILEEIVGEIQDEFDPTEAPQIEKENGGYLVDAQFDIDDLNEELNIQLPKPNCETIGGLIYSKLNRVPVPGEEITIREAGGAVLRVVEMTGPKIKRILLYPPPPNPKRNDE